MKYSVLYSFPPPLLGLSITYNAGCTGVQLPSLKLYTGEAVNQRQFFSGTTVAHITSFRTRVTPDELQPYSNYWQFTYCHDLQRDSVGTNTRDGILNSTPQTMCCRCLHQQAAIDFAGNSSFLRFSFQQRYISVGILTVWNNLMIMLKQATGTNLLAFITK